MTMIFSKEEIEASLVGVKFDEGKNRLDLLPVGAVEKVGEVLSGGAKKYNDRNWEKGIKFSRLFGAALRHLFSFWKKIEVDKESGQLHLAHAATNLLMLLELSMSEEMKEKFDDRP